MLYSDYYLWLDSLVNDGNHNELIRFLYEQPYVWQFTLDENRAAGGINLRRKFAFDNNIDIRDVGHGGCTILEMLIALSERMTEILSDDIFTWFWCLLRNLHLDVYDDCHFDANKVSDILYVWLEREYDPHGNGSLFPLTGYLGDCRTLDTWGQMNAWIAENFPHSDEWLN